MKVGGFSCKLCVLQLLVYFRVFIKVVLFILSFVILLLLGYIIFLISLKDCLGVSTSCICYATFIL